MRLLPRRRLDDDVLEMPILAVMGKALVRGPRLEDERKPSSKRSSASSIGMQKLANSLCR
jgi:hypothetical protein